MATNKCYITINQTKQEYDLRYLCLFVHVHVSQHGRFHGCKYSQFFLQVNQVTPELQDNQEHQEQEVIILHVTTITTGQ